MVVHTATTSAKRARHVTRYLARSLLRPRLICVNSAPTSPPSTPSSAMGSTCFQGVSKSVTMWNRPMPSNLPHSPSTCWQPELSSCALQTDTAQVSSVRHVSSARQRLVASSSPKNTPASGTPKLAASPAAAPHSTNSRASRSGCAASGFCICSRRSRALRPMAEAMMEPMCTLGPSLPMASPELTAHAVPTTLAMKVRLVKNLGTKTPLRYTFTSGMPEPAATGDSSSVTRHAAEAKVTLKHRKSARRVRKSERLARMSKMRAERAP
mmetsp:Transcript_39710/g.102842  ORF Transcript_39710/g.102842 Transcript_39710/m.102842 type:complete len:268 (+) Transcript_39710:1474-2277(+)